MLFPTAQAATFPPFSPQTRAFGCMSGAAGQRTQRSRYSSAVHWSPPLPRALLCLSLLMADKVETSPVSHAHCDSAGRTFSPPLSGPTVMGSFTSLEPLAPHSRMEARPPVTAHSSSVQPLRLGWLLRSCHSATEDKLKRASAAESLWAAAS